MSDDKKAMDDLKTQNKMLMERLMQLEKRVAGGEAGEAASKNRSPSLPASKKTRRPSHPRNKPAARPVRRSPRNHSPARSPHTPVGAMRRRLSFTSAGGSAKKKQRKTPTPAQQLVRKTLGDAIKLNMDHLLQSQFFKDKDRYFKVDSFAHRVQPLLEVLVDDDEVDTSMYAPSELFDMAVDIAKKRTFYKPKATKLRLSQTKKRRLRKAKQKKAAAVAAAAAAVATAAATADGSGSDDDAPAAACAALATSAQATEDHGEELRNFLELDAENQNDRDESKDVLAKKKSEAVTRKEAEKKKKDAAAAKKKETQKKKKVAAAAKKKEAAAKKKTAAAAAHADYIKKMGAAAVARSRRKSIAMKKKNAKKKEASAASCSLRVGMKVSGKWDNEQGVGEWYDGVVVSIDYERQTVFITYDDGDSDDAVPWENTRIQ